MRASCSPQSGLGAGLGDFLPLTGSDPHCPAHCCARVARGIRGMRTCRRPHLPPAFAGSPRSVPGENPALRAGYLPRRNSGRGSRSFPDLTGHLTVRADGGHAPPLSASGKPFRLAIILLSPPVRFPVLSPIKPHTPPLVCPPVYSFKFQPCGRTPQAAGLTASLPHRMGSKPTRQVARSVDSRDYWGL